jgi:hypothetical protein
MLALLAVAGTAWRLHAAWHTDFFMPAGDRNMPGEEANLNAILDALYLPSGSRLAEMALGSALGLLLRSPAALSWLKPRWAVWPLPQPEVLHPHVLAMAMFVDCQELS